MGDSKQLVLGIEGGATKTEWALVEASGAALTPIRSGRLPGGNLRLSGDDALRAMLACLPREPAAAGLFMAGCVDDADRERLRRLGAEAWPGARLCVGGDRESGFAAAFGDDDGILVIAGTGSAVTGRAGGRVERAGGWGHLLGDAGGGYDLAVRAIRRALIDYDTGARLTPFARDLLAFLGLTRLADLPDWVQVAAKPDVARLAPVVFEHESDPEIGAIIDEGACSLARLVEAVAHRLGTRDPSVQLTGGLFEHGAAYARRVEAAITSALPDARVAVSRVPGALGAARLAAATSVPFVPPAASGAADQSELLRAATEQAHPGSGAMDRLGVRELVRLFIEDAPTVIDALRGAEDQLVAAAECVAGRMSEGGRLIYVGAGTSGRLGVLDASEIPPTFGAHWTLVQGIIAGGAPALQSSVEGAEDSEESGALAVAERGVSARDVVCGITASGRTPFVRGALAAAANAGAATVLISCNPIRRRDWIAADVCIDLNTGPELITGSTRLKAGTATKIALNILSTIAMVRLGRVIGNQMADLRPTNAKLRERAVGIVAHRLEINRASAAGRLERTGWNVRRALDDEPA